MKKIKNSFRAFIVAVSTFFALELSDSPMRSLSYASLLLVAGGNFMLNLEEKLTEKIR